MLINRFDVTKCMLTGAIGRSLLAIQYRNVYLHITQLRTAITNFLPVAIFPLKFALTSLCL